MNIPDPATFIGKPCAIRLKGGKTLTRTILKIDIHGVQVDEGKGAAHTYPFAEIAHVRPTR